MARKPGDFGVVLAAMAFAAHKHRDQHRKGSTASPYINHPITLATLLWEEGGVEEPEILAAALLHDTLEDTETTYDELRGQFGATIADIVVEVSDVKWLRKDARKALQVARAGRATHGARLVKLADKIANLRDIVADPPEGWTLERKREYFDWAKSVIDKVRGTNARLEERFDEIYQQRP